MFCFNHCVAASLLSGKDCYEQDCLLSWEQGKVYFVFILMFSGWGVLSWGGSYIQFGLWVEGAKGFVNPAFEYTIWSSFETEKGS